MLPRKCKPIEENEDSLKSQTLQSGRKQWTLQSGPKSSLRRLRSRLAEDGCPESQVILAKQILQEDHENDEFIMDARDSAEVAIYWLLKAANQGNEEAFSLLEECMKTKSGISHHNYIDVKTCLQQSPEERAAFRAAVDIFQSLCRGEDFITSKQLEKRMQEVLQGKGDCLMSASHETLEELYGGEKLTKEHLIQAAASYTRGEMPVLANILKGAQTKSVGSHMYYLMIDSLAWHGWQFVLWFLPINRLQVTVLFLLYYILSTDILAYYLPCVMLYVSLLAAMSATCQLISWNRQFNSFHVWSKLFYTHCSLVDVSSAENKMQGAQMQTFVIYFTSIVSFLCIYPFVDESWLVNPEIGIFAMILFCCCCFGMPVNRNKFLMASTCIQVLVKTWPAVILLAPETLSSILGSAPVFQVHLFHVCTLNLNPVSCSMVFIPMCLYRALRKSSLSVYIGLFPYLVTMSWFYVACFFLSQSSLSGLLPSAVCNVILGLSFLPFLSLTVSQLLTLIFLLACLVPAAASIRYLTSEDVIIQACAAFVILIGLFLLLYCGHRDRWNLRRLDLIVKGLCAVSLCLVFFPALRRLSSITTTKSDPLPLLSWNTYNQLCLPRGVFTRAQLQSSCRFLEGALVEWEGTVKDVSLVESPSFINKMLSVLPASLQESIECMLGTPIENNPHTFAHLDCGTEVLNLRKLNVYRNQRCIYRGWDRPEFLITMSMSSGFWNIGSELLLQADHVFQNFTAALCPGDKIFFSATLHSNLGNSRPELIVKGLKCEKCFHPIIPIAVPSPEPYLSIPRLLNFLRNVFNFFWEPLIEWGGTGSQVL